jgi:hypothetical protein
MTDEPEESHRQFDVDVHGLWDRAASFCRRPTSVMLALESVFTQWMWSWTCADGSSDLRSGRACCEARRATGYHKKCFFLLSMSFPRSFFSTLSCCWCWDSLNPPFMSQPHFMQKNLHGFSLRANNTDCATAVCRSSYCQLLRIEGCRVVSTADLYGRNLDFLDRSPYPFYEVARSKGYQLIAINRYDISWWPNCSH